MSTVTDHWCKLIQQYVERDVSISERDSAVKGAEASDYEENVFPHPNIQKYVLEPFIDFLQDTTRVDVR